MKSELVTIKGLVKRSAEMYRDHVALQMKIHEQYQKLSYKDLEEYVKGLSSGLIKAGMEEGDRVALISENRPGWGIAYLGIVSGSGVVVPLDAQLKAEEIATLLKDSESKFIIASERFIDLLKKVKREIPSLRSIISLDAIEDSGEILGFKKLVSEGLDLKLEREVDLESLAAIVYTSGTTGRPKGVMLTHKNIMSNLLDLTIMFEIGPKDNFLSVLPLHHTFETMVGFLGPLYLGVTITYAESLKSHKILQNMQETKTTILVGVPLLYQLFYEGILREVEERPKLVKTIFKVLLGVSDFVRSLTGQNIGRALFRELHKKFGGNIRFMVSGGAAIDPEIIKGFETLGFTILQGYGLTETSPVLTADSLENNKIGSVGQALASVSIKISEPDAEGIGQILAQGPNIMQGYYKNPEASQEVFKEGWFYTGDLGYLDEDGFLYITGRLKDVIVTPAGKNVYPEEIEAILLKSPFIKEGCVVGKVVKEGIKKGTEEVHAVIFPNIGYFENYGEENNIKIDETVIDKIIKEEISKTSQQLADYKAIMGYTIRKEELPKTRLQKIKRYEVRKEINL